MQDVKTIIRLITSLLLISTTGSVLSQNMVYAPNIKTLQVTKNSNPLLPAVIKLGSSSYLTFSWDEMSHDYHRYIYRLEHCTWDWQTSDDMFESEWLGGLNNLPVEDYHTSFNTTQIYTHYSFSIPNANTSVLLSGNYRLQVFEDGNEDKGPVLESRFQVYEDIVGIFCDVSSNTDIDCNNSHQQVTLAMRYGQLDVSDPNSQIHTVVTQNRRPMRTVTNIPANIRSNTGLEWTHRQDLIFPAGNEYHKFEILDVHVSGMNVDNMRWYDPFFHATLWENVVELNYLSAEDQNGAFYPRTQKQTDNNTQSEYVIVHFALKSPRLNGNVYVNGQWSNGECDPSCRMEYNEAERRYEAAIMLKQGFYNYQYILEDGSTKKTMGDFWQTENEYQTFIYFRDLGGRYDRLVGFACVKSCL